MTNQDAQNYFARVVEQYVCGDISWLLGLGEGKEGKAGPLLNSVVNGIDILGGILDGFGRGMSERRSVKFLESYMGLQPDVARFIYTAVRCGMAHEGVPKMDVIFFVDCAAPDNEPVPLKDSQNRVWINVAVLAKRFLAAIEVVRNGDPAKVAYVPNVTSWEKKIITDGIAKIMDKFEKYYPSDSKSVSPISESSHSGTSQSTKQ